MSEPESADRANQIKDALLHGNKIQAIKLYREQTGVGLKEAKDAVEKLEAELRNASPERFTQPQAKGCSLGILVGILTLASLWRLLA